MAGSLPGIWRRKAGTDRSTVVVTRCNQEQRVPGLREYRKASAPDCRGKGAAGGAEATPLSHPRPSYTFTMSATIICNPDAPLGWGLMISEVWSLPSVSVARTATWYLLALRGRQW